MTDYSDKPGQTRCTRNCFECPQCLSPVDVKSQDEESEEGRGKRFFFQCVYCTFTYETKLVTKPAALHAILRRELPDQFGRSVARYTALHSINNQTDSGSSIRRDTASARLKAMNIKEVGSSDEKLELGRTVLENGPTDLARFMPDKKLQPRGVRLASKYKLSCAQCLTDLLCPVPDVRLMKFLSKQDAAEIVPQIVATSDSKAGSDSEGDIECALSIINNLTSSINVTISIHGEIPSTLSPTRINMSLPISTVTVKGKRDKVKFIDTIPTVLLGSETKAAQAEQVLRTGQRKQLTEGFLEEGHNWVTVPFILSREDSSQLPKTPIKVPFHIEVETKIPDLWKPLSNRRGLKYRFWVVTDVNVS